MKPTRSEVRGTWMLAAVCAVVLLAAACVSMCNRPTAQPEALPLPAAVQADSVAGADSVNVVGANPASSAVPAKRRKSSTRKTQKSRKSPKPQVPDIPSPLDRPV